jgi:diguanylate cyclase (GGDEF)-like protein
MIQHKEHARRLEQTAHIDDLTGLPNLTVFGDRLLKAIAQSKQRSQRLAVVRLDLDGLEAINDRHGYDVGDQVLASLSNGMKRTLRKGDTLARVGGNEFAAVLLDLEDAQACVPALNRLLGAAAELVQAGDATFQLSASIGVAFCAQAEDADANQLLHQASQAMHQAKAAGRNRTHFFDSAPDYSVRNACMGSMEAARRAGIQHAARAMAMRNRGASTKVSVSCG